jgi:hypothetical protein
VTEEMEDLILTNADEQALLLDLLGEYLSSHRGIAREDAISILSAAIIELVTNGMVGVYQGTRHSSMMAAVERVGYDDVQEFVGHANRAMTKRYGKPSVKRLERVLRTK